MRINGGILGRAVTANVGGRYNAVDTNLLRKQQKTGTYLIDVVAVGGGGGAGGSYPGNGGSGENGGVNTGGGAGAGYFTFGSGTGGSGIVIIRYTI